MLSMIFWGFLVELIIDSLQYIGLYLDDFLNISPVDPVLEARRIYLFVLHGHEEAGLDGGYDLKLIMEAAMSREVQIHILYTEVEGGSFEVELII